MTKCHILFLAALALLTLSCKQGRQETSLSAYGSRSQATREAQFEQFAVQMRSAPLQEGLRMQDSLLRAAEQDSAKWAMVTHLEEKYFLDPNSYLRSEELYLPVARHILNAPYSSDEQRRYARWLLPRLMLNRPGEPAADFEFVSPKGRRSSLSATLAQRKPRQTLLFFSNPGCPNCLEITQNLNANTTIQERIADGYLLVVNIYPDEDIQAWLDYLPHYPETWVCGHDPDQVLNSETVYWLRAIPSLYLLDAQGRVILKDAPLEEVLVNCK